MLETRLTAPNERPDGEGWRCVHSSVSPDGTAWWLWHRIVQTDGVGAQDESLAQEALRDMGVQS